jgi:hypothetical protein
VLRLVLGDTCEDGRDPRRVAHVQARAGDESGSGLTDASIDEGPFGHGGEIRSDLKVRDVERRGPQRAAAVVAGELEARRGMEHLIQSGGCARSHELRRGPEREQRETERRKRRHGSVLGERVP